MAKDLEKRAKIKEMLLNNKPRVEIADELVCGNSLISSVRRELGDIFKTSNSPKKPNKSGELVEEMKQDSYLLDIDKNTAKQEINLIKNKNKELVEEVQKKMIADKVYEEVIKDTDKIKIDKADKMIGESTAVLVASDAHIEETIDIDTMNGLNEYNTEIAQDRFKNFFSNGMYLVNTLKESQNIQHIVLALLGDFISGYIHPELMENNGMSPTEAIIFAKRILTSGIDFMLESSDLPILVVTAFGNHGRTTDKKRISTGWKNSYERMMYIMMADEYKNNPRVQFKVEKGYHNYVNVYDKVLRMHHGDAMKYQGGVGGITIPVNKAIAQRNKAKHADLDVFGHRHQLRDGGNYICNGSLIGYGPYSEAIKADFEEPKQAFFLINSEFGKTISAPILVK